MYYVHGGKEEFYEINSFKFLLGEELGMFETSCYCRAELNSRI